MAISKVRLANGFTLIELLLTLGIFSTLIGISSISLLNTQRKSSLSSAVQLFTADLRAQQIRAMVGEDEAGGSASDYGVHFETSSYTQFKGIYGTNNFSSNLPPNTNVVTTFPSSQIVFIKGSGEIAGFSNGTNTVTFQDVNDGNQKIITINRYGVVISIN
ncbi:MAG TPA: prepilin-type N-terminal cleavage/methylation domain-containing protein [Candidatus Limnocylindrales bacterium]|nr:prepilin-type N-terminal cleavage/methylation domain-containing protein [Candidatus Limnocylindrales bacterium]